MQPTIEARLRQVQDYGLPHIVRTGNTITKCLVGVVGILEGNVPEVIEKYYLGMDDLEKLFFYTLLNNADKITEALSKAQGTNPDPKIFLRICEDKHKKLSREFVNIEVHAFYNPKTNLTHYFLMPAREIKQSNCAHH